MAKKKSREERVFTPLKRYAWLFMLVVGVGGLWVPRLGIFIIPVMITLMVMGLLRGKYWCGNICPHGSFFDGIILPWSRGRDIPPFFRSRLLAALLLGWFMYMMVSRLVVVIPTLGEAGFLDRLGFVFVINYFVVTVVGTALALLINPRAWCLACPMGTFQLLLYRLGCRLGINRKTDLRLAVADPGECRSCGKCSRACPVQLSPYPGLVKGQAFDHGQCFRCSTCAHNCPAGLLSLEPGQRETPAGPYPQPGTREDTIPG